MVCTHVPNQRWCGFKTWLMLWEITKENRIRPAPIDHDAKLLKEKEFYI